MPEARATPLPHLQAVARDTHPAPMNIMCNMWQMWLSFEA
jgi:hypothetical protein